MKRYMINEETLEDIADAIREKTDSSMKYRPQSMAAAIAAIDSSNNPRGIYLGGNCDDNGVWHQPIEWDDIEYLPIYEDHDVVYI